MANQKEAPAAEPVEPIAAPVRSRRGLKLGGIIAAGVLAAVLLFGGGVLLGTALPHGGDRPGFSQGQLPPGPQPLGGGGEERERPDNR